MRLAPVGGVQAAIRQTVKTAATTVLRRQPLLCSGLLRAAAARRRSLVLCYHRVTPESVPNQTIEPLYPDRFAEQMDALQEAGNIVPLDVVLRHPRSHRATFAVTFDDDDTSHVRYALPILRARNITATFFLSGRSLHGLGGYWWVQLQQAVDEDGLEATCRRLGRSAASVRDLARQCRENGVTDELSTRGAPPMMSGADVRRLAEAGMTIGFHTLRHPNLTLLNDRDLDAALTEGREALAAAANAPVEFFAYPYGRTDASVAAAVRRAGYRAAFALGDGPIAPRDDRFALARWQPGSLAASDLVGEAALRLNRTDYLRAIRA